MKLKGIKMRADGDTEMPVLDNPILPSLDFNTNPTPEVPNPLPGLSDMALDCNNVSEVLAKAVQVTQTMRPTAEVQAQIDAWFVKANGVKALCGIKEVVVAPKEVATATTTPIVDKQTTMNLKPALIVVGLVVGVIVLSKLLKNE